MFKILVTTEFSDQVVNYARTVREFVVNSSWQCGIMRANAHHVTIVTKSSRTAHVEFTSSSRHFHELVRVAVWPCLLTHAVTWTSRIDVTSCSRLVYTPHEQFVHDTSSSRRVHEQLMSRSQLLSDSCNRVGAAHQALYVETTSKFSLDNATTWRCSNVLWPLGGIYVSWTLFAISLHATHLRFGLFLSLYSFHMVTWARFKS